MHIEQEYYDISIKVVLLGECGVGKTSIANRLIENTFSSDVLSTIGGCFLQKTIKIDNNTKISFEIWDTAGQEQYRSLLSIFYRGTGAFILIYDKTSKLTFDSLSYWIQEIEEKTTEKPIIVIVANKNDLYQFEEVKDKEGAQFAKEKNAFFCSTSAKSGNGVEELFKKVGKMCVNPVYPKTITMEDNNEKKKKDKNEGKNNRISLGKENCYNNRKNKKKCCE